MGFVLFLHLHVMYDPFLSTQMLIYPKLSAPEFRISWVRRWSCSGILGSWSVRFSCKFTSGLDTAFHTGKTRTPLQSLKLPPQVFQSFSLLWRVTVLGGHQFSNIFVYSCLPQPHSGSPRFVGAHPALYPVYSTWLVPSGAVTLAGMNCSGKKEFSNFVLNTVKYFVNCNLVNDP